MTRRQGSAIRNWSTRWTGADRTGIPGESLLENRQHAGPQQHAFRDWVVSAFLPKGPDGRRVNSRLWRCVSREGCGALNPDTNTAPGHLDFPQLTRAEIHLQSAPQMLNFSDRLTLDAPRTTREGYLAVRAKAARAGIYEYSGAEVDPDGTKFKSTDTVRVYRSTDEVFARDAVHSFLMKPITDDHPTEPVTSANWTDKARGVVAGAMRDGDYLAFDLVIMDARLIAEVQSGKKELSNGYATDLKFEAGMTPKGEAYDAYQSAIRGNHVAIVKAGRAGSECRIADGVALCDSAPANLFGTGDKSVAKVIVHDGISIEFTDQAADAYNSIKNKLAASVADVAKLTSDHTAAIATKDKELATKDAEIDGLKAKVLDAKALDALVAGRASLITQAKALHDADYSGKSDMEIRKAVLAAKSIAHDGKSDDYVTARFEALADTVKDGLATALGNGGLHQTFATDTYQAGLAASKKMADGFNAWRKDN